MVLNGMFKVWLHLTDNFPLSGFWWHWLLHRQFSGFNRVNMYVRHCMIEVADIALFETPDYNGLHVSEWISFFFFSLWNLPVDQWEHDWSLSLWLWRHPAQRAAFPGSPLDERCDSQLNPGLLHPPSPALLDEIPKNGEQNQLIITETKHV